jgi:hypothetical protein
MEMNNYISEGLINIRALMSIIITGVVRELGIMHLIVGSKIYKTTPRMVTYAMERINDLPICVGEVVCKMNFMVVDINGYDILLELDVLIKIGVNSSKCTTA